jgi:DinB superfamily
MEWSGELTDQLDWHWVNQLRPRLGGLGDAEYRWEPVPGCWSVRPRADATTPQSYGSGEYVLERAWPAPEPAPVTTIAWRLAHLIIVFGARAAAHFGGPPFEAETFPYAGTAAGALGQLDAAYAAWIGGVRGLDDAALELPCGPAEGPYAKAPMAALVLHINREAIHHGAEIALLRDLYAHQPG